MTMIEILLKYGAETNIQDKEDLGANTPLHLAAERDMKQAIAMFLNKGGDADLRNQLGFTCLHIAAREGHADLAKMLVDAGVNVEVRDEFGYSPAYWAHQHKHEEIMKKLPEPRKISKEEYYEHIQQVWAKHDFKPGGGKKKKKKGKKKK